ncbi:MAG TPA: phosphoribosylanthranilate isomerase [Kofleriaceae bacterium]|nr:phosphoribosylanthranilate isomerase [Kofleriaceae bacterium]
MTAIAVKICGVTRPDDASFAAQVGADYLGLNFWSGSKRRVEVGQARALARCARAGRPAIRLVGLFVDAPAAEVIATATALGLEVVQLHGDEGADVVAACRAAGLEVWKAVPVAGAADVDDLGRWGADALLLDAPSAGRGGSGQQFDWSHAARAVAAGHRVVLAGGLTAANVATAIQAVRPFAVDVASGVEQAAGVKDPVRVQHFLDAARRGVSYLTRR